jgi:hypothetical protein
MMNFQTENRGEKLWVPSGTVAQENKEYVEQYFGSNARVEQFLLKFSDGDSVLSPDAFDAAFALHNKVVAVEADNPEAVGETLTWDNYCLKRGPECTQWNVLDLFNYDPSSWTTREAILNVINDAVPDPDPAAVDDTGTCDVSGGFEITQLLGGITYEGGRIVGASVLSFGYLLQNNLILLDDNSFADRQVSIFTNSDLGPSGRVVDTATSVEPHCFSHHMLLYEFSVDHPSSMRRLRRGRRNTWT